MAIGRVLVTTNVYKCNVLEGDVFKIKKKPTKNELKARKEIVNLYNNECCSISNISGNNEKLQRQQRQRRRRRQALKLTNDKPIYTGFLCLYRKREHKVELSEQKLLSLRAHHGEEKIKQLNDEKSLR